MPDNEISEDIKKQVDAAMSGSRDTLDAPMTAEPKQQPVPDAPADMSNVPDAYDVQGQEAYQAGKREQAVEARDAAPEVAKAAEPTVNTPVGDLSEADNDAALKAGAKIKNVIEKEEIATAPPDAAPSDVAPAPDPSLEPAPAPKAPDIDKE